MRYLWYIDGGCCCVGLIYCFVGCGLGWLILIGRCCGCYGWIGFG